MKQLCVLAAMAVLGVAPVVARAADPAARLVVVAAENFYGDVAAQIGGPRVAVTSILSNPDQDPHLFEASPSVARAVAGARLVIYNGVDYDPWIERLLGAARDAQRKTIAVADLVHRKSGDNPHIWYDPATMPAAATALADAFGEADPAHRADYRRRLDRFRQSLLPIDVKIAGLRQRAAGTSVTATEPVFFYMFSALGMQVRNQPFQLAVMNSTEPSASAVAAFEDDLKTRRVRLLVVNSQASGPLAQRMAAIAKASHVPVVAVTETEPPGKDYQAWVMSELEAIDRALAE